MPKQQSTPTVPMIGRWRQISPEVKHKIMERLRAGAKSSELEREYGVCFNTIAKLRRLIGDVPGGPGRKPKLSPAALQQAEQRLRNGDRWCVVAAAFGVSPTTLVSRLRYRKRRAG
jgi:hypothetical protein